MVTKMVTLAAVAVLLASTSAFAALPEGDGRDNTALVQYAQGDDAVSQVNAPAYWINPETGRERSGGEQ